jgi:renalase
MESNNQCLIIGAGIAGLAAARVLQSHGFNVAVLDKGRGVGGRLATRWSDNEAGERAFYDHGAQFFTVRDAAFQTQVNEWLARGLVKEWARGFANASGQPQYDGHPRYCTRRMIGCAHRSNAGKCIVGVTASRW